MPRSNSLKKRIERIGDRLLGRQGQDRLTVLMLPVFVGKDQETDLAAGQVLADQQVNNVQVSGNHLGFAQRSVMARNRNQPNDETLAVRTASKSDIGSSNGGEGETLRLRKHIRMRSTCLRIESRACGVKFLC